MALGRSGVVVMAVSIGTRLRIEGGLNYAHRNGKLLKHPAEHRITREAQPAIPDLQGDVSVAEMVCGATPASRIYRPRFHERFVERQDLQNAAIVTLQAVAVMHYRVIRKQKRDFFPVRKCGAQPPALT